MPQMGLKDKVAIVTGAGPRGDGIGNGRAAAILLAREGTKVALLDAMKEWAEATKAMIDAEGGTSMVVIADVADQVSSAASVKATVNAWGRLDILVNNAGIQHVAALQDFPPEKWDAILAINLSSAFHTTRLALPAMLKNKWGRIINIASAHALVGSPFKSAYVAAKHGILGLTKVTALETAEHDITCNAICPGYVYTPLVEAQIDGQAKAHGIPREQVIRDVLLAQQPNKRFATVDELGALVVFLASAAAASITGAALAVDGGWTAH